MAISTRTFTVEDDTPLGLRKADRAVQSLAGTTRSQTRALFEQGNVQVNGKPCEKPFQRLQPGDVLELRRDEAHRPKSKTKARTPQGFETLHEDEHIIVVIKPAALLTVPSPKGESDTLIGRVARHLGRGRPAELHAVQRLDRGVSGVLVMARTGAARAGLRDQFSRHQPEREYLALVAGGLSAEEGTFQSNLITNKSLSRVSTTEGGEEAITHWRVEARLAQATQVRVRLETGRRNQIRVHFAEAGHPVLGDPRYLPEQAQHRSWTAKRLALHAAMLSFEHPASGKPMRLEAPTPQAMAAFIRKAARPPRTS